MCPESVGKENLWGEDAGVKPAKAARVSTGGSGVPSRSEVNAAEDVTTVGRARAGGRELWSGVGFKWQP